jgi:hypothetical protein
MAPSSNEKLNSSRPRSEDYHNLMMLFSVKQLTLVQLSFMAWLILETPLSPKRLFFNALDSVNT